MPPTLGGGFVFRDDLEKAAAALSGRHSFEPVGLQLKFDLRRKAANAFNVLRGRPRLAPPVDAAALFAEVERRRIDLLWYNHIPPVHIGVPYLINIFDLQHRLQPAFPEVSSEGQWEYRERVWSDGVRRAALVTVGSDEARAQLSHFYGVPLERIFVLPFPTPQRAIDIARGAIAVEGSGDIRAKYGIKGDFLFYPAQFWPHKNHVNLLLGLKLLQSRGRKVSLVLTGSDHGNRSHVEAVAQRLGLSDEVHFCGFVPYEDILAFYRQACALSYVSFFGPENLPPLEAMALGCPVIMADIAGVQTLHGDGPYLVDPRKPEAIADGVEWVLDNPDQVAGRVTRARNLALHNDCGHYLERLQQILDEFAFMRRGWA